MGNTLGDCINQGMSSQIPISQKGMKKTEVIVNLRSKASSKSSKFELRNLIIYKKYMKDQMNETMYNYFPFALNVEFVHVRHVGLLEKNMYM